MVALASFQVLNSHRRLVATMDRIHVEHFHRGKFCWTLSRFYCLFIQITRELYIFTIYVTYYKKLLDEPIRISLRTVLKTPVYYLQNNLLGKYFSDLHTRTNSVSPQIYQSIMAGVNLQLFSSFCFINQIVQGQVYG